MSSLASATKCNPKMGLAWEYMGFALQKTASGTKDFSAKVRNYEKAIAAYDQALSHDPRVFYRRLAHLGLAASYSELDRPEEAKGEIAQVLKLNPQFSLERMRQRWPYQEEADLERVLAALRKAGLK